MSEPLIENAIIKSASISMADHGLLTVHILLRYSRSVEQGFGGFFLHRILAKDHEDFAQNGPTGYFLQRCMEVAGVERWENMPGKIVRVRKKTRRGFIDAIGHALEDDWFDPEADIEWEKSQ